MQLFIGVRDEGKYRHQYNAGMYAGIGYLFHGLQSIEGRARIRFEYPSMILVQARQREGDVHEDAGVVKLFQQVQVSEYQVRLRLDEKWYTVLDDHLQRRPDDLLSLLCSFTVVAVQQDRFGFV